MQSPRGAGGVRAQSPEGPPVQGNVSGSMSPRGAGASREGHAARPWALASMLVDVAASGGAPAAGRLATSRQR
eukprot:7850186-Pyramimonas_sp.AAC.1